MKSKILFVIAFIAISGFSFAGSDKGTCDKSATCKDAKACDTCKCSEKDKAACSKDKSTCTKEKAPENKN